MKYKLVLCLLTALLSTNISSPVKATEDLPTIYVTIVSHNEEPSFPNHPNFVNDYDTYQSFRNGAVNFAEMLKSEGVKYDFQSDWNFLLAEQENWSDFDNTNGKNLLRWLVEDMGFAVDPHAHESTYSIADVAYLMEQLDIIPSNIVGGFIATPAEDSRVEDFQVPIEGWIYNTSWEADALWGGGSGNHVNDEGQWTSGIWRAQDNDHFFIDDPDSKPVIGSYTSTWEGLDDLLEKRANGELDPNKMYTANIMTNQEDAQDQDFIDEFQNEIQARQSYTDSGAIVWVTLPEALEIWETEYDSVPETYNYVQGEITSSVVDNTSTADTAVFSDVDSNDDYYESISYVYEEGIVEGYSDGTYRSTSPINRAEFTKILIESANPGEAEQSESCFTDVDAAAWYAKYICFAKVYNIVDGYPDGSFKPAQSINIVEALKITLETYFDTIPSASGEWYQKYWDFAEEQNYLLNDWESPAQELTRGEMAELIYRIMTGTSSSTEASKELSEKNVLFTVNTQEFIFGEESIETMNRIIDIHEDYNIPVDIYLDDQILQVYLDEAPELIERFKTSSVVSISYHARPPVPYYYDYDWLGLESYSQTELETLIEAYGTHAIDSQTGQTTDEEGGFSYFEEVFGYAPPAAATPTSSTTGSLVKNYFAENGASFLVENDRDYSWGDTKEGIAVRPEDVEVKLFERTNESAEDIFSELDSLTGDGPYFMNIKVHDNDFITDESAWVAIYVANKKQNRGTLTPPFDLSLAQDRDFLSEEESEVLWDAYEACVAYAANHQVEYTTWNMMELIEEL